MSRPDPGPCFIPTEEYSAADAERALADANEVYDCARWVISEDPGSAGEACRGDRRY